MPDGLTSTAGNTRRSEILRSSLSSALPVPLNSSKITVSPVDPVSTIAVAMIVSEPPCSILRAAPLVADTSVGDDDLWVVDSTPVECARSTETVKRSDLAGWAQYGYCASHSRYFWGLRLHLLCTVHGLPLGWALTGAKADERDVLIEILSTTSTLVSNTRESATIIGDKNYYGRAFEATLADQGITLLRPARKGETPSPGHRFFKPLRQIIESVNDTLKGQLDLEHHQGRTIAGVCTRIGQRILALTAAIWHNDRIGHTIRRSLTPYDH